MELRFNMISEDVKVVQHERLMRLLESWHPVSCVIHSDYEDKLCWCMEHCIGKFRDVVRSDRRVWYFERHDDATMFALKWADA
jgi:hypothetical protein